MILGNRFAQYAPAIAELPEDTPLAKADLLRPEFRLHREQTRNGLLEIYYSPIDVVNAQARVVLIGICPGFAPMQMAYAEAALCLQAGLPHDEAQERAKRRAQWVGQTRVNLIAMLNALDVPAHLGIPSASASALFDTHTHLLHSSAAVRYPVFVKGGNYSGYGPDFLKTPVLRRYIETTLPEELAHIGKALVILLGRSVSESLQALIGEQLHSHDRLVISAPHPSTGPGNAQRKQMFADRLPTLKPLVQEWFKTQNE
jgi:hypothetical protein